jgi:hypothetical protein
MTLLKVFITVLSLTLAIRGQGQYSRHIIELTDKGPTPYTLSNPGSFLSAQALKRRMTFNIPVDSTDLPVPAAYLDSISAAGKVSILNTSRWFNRVLIQTSDAAALQKINGFPFVKKMAPVAARPVQAVQPVTKFDETMTQQPLTAQLPSGITENSFNYGNSSGQIHLHEGEFLHNAGFHGEGMTVAVLDAGFFGYLANPAFDSIRAAGGILGTWDFVRNETPVNEDHPHGMYCFSIMAANMPGVLVGSSPHASYYLFRTEDAATEYPVEEQNWTAAAEIADSLGVDLITSSLGYYQFDDPAFNHTYADLNGHTTMITRAADMAVSKGMIVTNSAGNSGSSAWKYINAPSDGDSVLAVGAVNVNGETASFSSFGPSADGRVKPDVSSVGWGTFVAGTNGTAIQGNGTSFSNPNLAGLILCLWQAFPEFRNTEILAAVVKSSDQYDHPDDRKGYGIPNMRVAYQMLSEIRTSRNMANILGDDWIKIYPVPVKSALTVLYKAEATGQLLLELFDVAGRQLLVRKETVNSGQYYSFRLNELTNYPSGVYFLRYSDGLRQGTLRLAK